MSTTASTDHLSSVDVELFKAIADADLEAFVDALGAEANTNAEYAGWTPMTLAMHHLQGRSVPFIRALIHTGADVNQPELASGTNRTPLLFALHGGSLSVVKMLLDAGANPTAPDRDGHTPLKLAQLAGDPLLSAAMGAAVVQRKDGNTSTPDELNLALELLTGALQGVAASHGGAEQARPQAAQQEVAQQAGDSGGSPTTAAPASAPQTPVSSTTSTTRPAWYEEVERSLEFFEPRRLELAKAAAKATEQDIAAFSLQPGGELGHFVTLMVAVAEWVASVGRVYAMSLADTDNEDMTLDEVQFARLAYREAVGGVMQRLVLHPFSVPMESMDQDQFMTLYDVVANLSPRTDLYPDDLKAALSIVLSSRYLVHSCLLLLARVALGLMTLEQLPKKEVFDRFHQQYESTDPTRDRENIYPRAADLQAVCTLSVEVETLLDHDRAGHLAKRFPSDIPDGMTDERLLVLTKAWLAQLGAYRSTIEVTDNGQRGVKNSATFTDVLRDISQGGSRVQVNVVRDTKGVDNAVVYLDDGADGFADYFVAVAKTAANLGVRSTTTSVAIV